MPDEELRAAIRAVLLPALRPEWFAEKGEEGLEALTDVLVKGQMGASFRQYHAKYGCYPDELPKAKNNW